MTQLFSLFVFFVFVRADTHGFTNIYPKLKKFVLDKNADVGEPLFLTPLIESGKIDEARKEAIVEHKEIGAVSSYAGYFTVNKEYNSNLFFWFFPAQVSQTFDSSKTGKKSNIFNFHYFYRILIFNFHYIYRSIIRRMHQ